MKQIKSLLISYDTYSEILIILFLTNKLTQFWHGNPGPHGEQYESDQHHSFDDPDTYIYEVARLAIVRLYSPLEIAISDSDIENAYDGPVAWVYIK